METRGLLTGPDFNPTVSEMQAGISVRRLKGDGQDFWAGKISEGIDWKKPAKRTMEKVRESIEIDLPCIVYHFGWGNNVSRQVDTILDAIGSKRLAQRIGIAIDVETYNGHVKMRRDHVLGIYRELARRLGKDLFYWLYTGDWFWYGVGRIDREGKKPVLQILKDEGIRVKVWSSPDTGYSDTAGLTIKQTAKHVPASEFTNHTSHEQRTIVQVDDACVVAGYHPLDGNVSRASQAEIRTFTNWRGE